MFYANFILSKKGPLARVWLAAHWEKKLSKAHVFDTDVQASVESIISPKVKMALRTSGHLLLGVVRIYSRKTKYLLADCTEALVKIKMAFRPGVVDLPEESREAAMSAVTLPEVFSDFDIVFPELNDIDLQAQLAINQSRADDITMKEDIVSVNLFINDDGFGDMPFDSGDEKEIMRAGSVLDDSLYISRDNSKLLIDDTDMKNISDTTLERSKLDIALDEPIKDDGFGGNDGNDILADGFGDEFGGGIIPDFEDELIGGEKDITLDELDSTLTKDQAPEAEEEGQVVEKDKEEEEEKEAEEKKEEEEEEKVEEKGSPDIDTVLGDVPNETANNTTLVPNGSEAFVLEPVEILQKDKRSRRKRKLVVDEEKKLSSAAIKTQLSDTSDIVQPPTVAPPTKLRMRLKETSTVDKLFALSSVDMFAPMLVGAFSCNLTHKVLDESEVPDIEEQMELDEPELARAQEEQPSEVLDRTKDTSVLLPEPETLADATVDASVSKNLEEEIVNAPEQTETHLEGLDNMTVDQEIPEELAQLPEEAPLSQAEEEKQLDNEKDEDFQERRWTKRTQRVLNTLRREFENKSTVNFSEMIVKENRKQAASKFYSCLLLYKESSILIEQNESFGDILLKQGSQFGVAA